MKNGEPLLCRVNKERNILQVIKRRETDWIGHILRRNCIQKHVFGGNRRGIKTRRRRKQLLDDLEEKRILELEGGSTR